MAQAAIAPPVKSNCLMYALKRFWRDEDSYVVLLWSPRWWGIHARWTKDFKTFWEFIPTNPARRVLPPLRFKGRVRAVDLTQKEM